MLTDFSYAFRTLRKSPIFTITVVVTIALAIGASTAIFSVTNGVLLRQLPYKDPERLVLVRGDLQKRNVKDFPVSNVDYLDVRNGAKNNFDDFVAVQTFRFTLPGLDGTPERIRAAAVSTNFFQMMGGSIIAGRDFQESDGTPDPNQAAGDGNAPAANAPPPLPNMVILSNEYFQQRFGGDRSMIGKTLPVAAAFGPPPIIVGVVAPGFELLFPPKANIEQFPSIWIASRIPYDVANRNNVQWRVIGRLKSGASIGQAQAETDTIIQKIRAENTISNTAGQHFQLVPMKQHLVDEVRPTILALMGAVIFLLLIACANVANLMLVRASSRERELAVRAALGAGWWQLVRQTLAEAFVIAALGTAIGVGLAYLGIRQLLAIAPENLPRLNAIGIDWQVLGFSVLAGLVSAVIFGIIPAVRTAKPNLMDTLRASGRTGALGAAGLRNAVVVVEVALAFVLLIGSGLMVRTFINIQRVKLGFEPRGLLTFQLLGNIGRNTPQELDTFKRQLREQLDAIPGVNNVTASFPLPLAGGFSPIRWGGAEAENDPSKFQAADLQIVLPGYFEAMGATLLAGRTFTQEDNTPDRNVIIIDQALAAKAFPNESAVGKRILYRVRTPQAQWGEIIGVVAHARNTSLIEPGREQLYVTDGYFNHQAASWWALRTDGDPSAIAGSVREVVRRLGSDTYINDMQPMDALVVQAQAQTRFSLLLIGVFSTIAALLAGVGLYGVLATSVRQRTAEIGVRMALGAAPSRIFRLMVGKGLYLSAIGIAIGLVGAFALTRVLASMLVEVKPTDPVTFVSVAVLFLVIAFLASWLPAVRAAGLDPTTALRNE